MSDGVDDVSDLTAALRAAVKVRGLGPNSLALLEVGDCIALTPSEAEEAARALRPFIAKERRLAAERALADLSGVVARHAIRSVSESAWEAGYEAGVEHEREAVAADRYGVEVVKPFNPYRADRRTERHV